MLRILLSMLLTASMPSVAQMTMPMPPNQSQGARKHTSELTASLRENILRHTTSGTDLEPDSSNPPMLMQMRGNWMFMLHGQAALAEQRQNGPRGRDKLFSANWIMPMAQRSLGPNQLSLRAMLSLEPATISGRYYPELFQLGETAFGKPIVDGQHPHNLFMELAVLYDSKLGESGLLSLYAAPVGDPALGPVAFPHRASAAENPLAPLGHHLQDSTHIAYDVLTGGLAWSRVRVEASGFSGREPGENRLTIAAGALDSWSARIAATPASDWAAQYSIGHLHSPEASHPNQDILRQTASLSYRHTGREATLDSLALWGRNHTVSSPLNWNSYLFEATARFKGQHMLWTRIENVDRTSDLLDSVPPTAETVIGRVQAVTAGYTHRLLSTTWSTSQIGAQATVYHSPPALQGAYSDHPAGVAVVLNVHLGPQGWYNRVR